MASMPVESVRCQVGRGWLTINDVNADRWEVSARLYLASEFPTIPSDVQIVPGNMRPIVHTVLSPALRGLEQTLANL
jgi:hypothetical protein